MANYTQKSSLSGSWIKNWLNTHIGDRPILLGVSGGLDSMVLWTIVHDSGHPYEVAHVNYQLRGVESNLDQKLVEQTAENRSCELHVKRTSQVQKSVAGLQEAARTVRHEFFSTLCSSRNLVGTLLAHHADDQLENLLIGLIRGSGPAVLGGMKEVNDLNLGRPLLGFTKVELAAFAKTRGITYRLDESNLADDYLRNRIRHHVVPALKEVHEGALKGSLRAMGALRSLLETTQRSQVIQSIDKLLAGFEIERSVLAKEPGLSYFLHLKLEPLGFASKTLTALERNLQSSNRNPKRFQSKDRSREIVVTWKTVRIETL